MKRQPKKKRQRAMKDSVEVEAAEISQASGGAISFEQALKNLREKYRGSYPPVLNHPKIQGRPRIGNILRTGVWNLLEDDMVRFIRKWPEDFEVRDADIWPLLHAALDPGKMNDPACVGLRMDFCRLYATHPDFVLAFLSAIRKKWNSKESKFKVKKFLLSRHGWIDDSTNINSEEKLDLDMEPRIAEMLNVKNSSVKKARQELARRSLGR